MDFGEIEYDLVEGSERLLNLTGILNLEDCDKSSELLCLYPFVDDFFKLRDHLLELKKIICSYGLDSQLFNDALFKKMQVLACRLAFHSACPNTYCNLRSCLFLDANEFYDEVFSELEIRLMSCTCEDEIERLVQSADKLRNIYHIYM